MNSTAPLILIIEDETMLLELETLILQRAGYRVVGFGSGEEALAAPQGLLREARVALVDAVFGGLEAVQALRKLNADLRTAIVTGKEFEPHPDVDQIIPLPSRPEDLLQRVRELMT